MGNDLRTVLVVSLEYLLKCGVVQPSEIRPIERIMEHYSLPDELYQHCVSVVYGYYPKLPKNLKLDNQKWEDARQELRVLAATSCRVVNCGNEYILIPGRYNKREVFDERIISEETVKTLKGD